MLDHSVLPSNSHLSLSFTGGQVCRHHKSQNLTILSSREARPLAVATRAVLPVGLKSSLQPPPAMTCPDFTPYQRKTACLLKFKGINWKKVQWLKWAQWFKVRTLPTTLLASGGSQVVSKAVLPQHGSYCWLSCLSKSVGPWPALLLNLTNI